MGRSLELPEANPSHHHWASASPSPYSLVIARGHVRPVNVGGGGDVCSSMHRRSGSGQFGQAWTPCWTTGAAVHRSGHGTASYRRCDSWQVAQAAGCGGAGYRRLPQPLACMRHGVRCSAINDDLEGGECMPEGNHCMACARPAAAAVDVVTFLKGVYSKKLPHYRQSFRKATGFFNFSKCYHYFGRLFQKTLVTESLSFDQVYDREGPRVRRKII
uniref:Uncharacterized protein n=1 Tax=Aegilops tauschii subsp. strangulata TaxID=200361 RepID=A0A453DA22_AEGTS